MYAVIFYPVISFLLYLGLTSFLYLVGRYLAGAAVKTSMKTSTYASGEVAPTKIAAPGYRPFFIVALFFAVLHLGTLVLGSGGTNGITSIYLAGLILTLLALILG
jgi:NADH:ubiquinone oxidoreductase subunit 3 (subunit A)